MKKFFLIFIFLFTFFIAGQIYASESNGTIDSSFKLTKLCKNSSCSDFGNINWKPTLNANTTGATAVSITDSAITGYIWGDEIGWVNLAPTGAGVSIDPNTGVLSGTAYASVGGWINFSPTGSGVSLIDNGSGSNFYGYAYVSGINGGWIKFDCADSSTCIKTDWRTVSNRESVASPSGSSGGGLTIFPIKTQPTNDEPTPPGDSGEFSPPIAAYENFPGDKTTLPPEIINSIDNNSDNSADISNGNNSQLGKNIINNVSNNIKDCQKNFTCILGSLKQLFAGGLALLLLLIFGIYWGWKKYR